jgi:hypothetical protein
MTTTPVEEVVGTIDAPTVDTPSGQGPPDSPIRTGRAPRYLTAGGLYLAASIGLWWHVWTRGPSSVMTCSCTDAGRAVWYMQWSVFALAHGHSLFFSNWLFHPNGFNLLADTSVPAITLVMTPVTALWGPVAGVNVAATLIPALSALSMFWLLQRWVRWAPAAFVGGLCYGFSAFVVVQLAFGWLNLACTVLLPLMAGCLDDLLVRQRRRPLGVGVALGVLITVEFFVSSEILLISVIAGLVALVLLAAYGLRQGANRLRVRARHAAVGLGAAIGVAAVLLAYPLWFFAAGPGHLGTIVWSTNVPGDLGNTLGNFWNHLGQFGPVSTQALVQEVKVLGGYRGPATPSPSYLGPGLLLVVVVGLLIWRKDRRLWFFGGLALLLAALSLRVGGTHWGPWALVYHLSVLQNVVQYRFSAVIGLCVSIILAVIVDRSRTDLLAWSARRSQRTSPGVEATRPSRAAWWAGGVALVVAAVALGPEAVVLEPNIPLAVQPVSVPRWFQDTAVHLPTGQVLLTYPFATADSQSSIPWQAIDGMRYQMAGGGGPAGTVVHAGAEKAGFSVLRAASLTLVPAPTLSADNLTAVRRAMGAWGVTKVVVPNSQNLPAYQQARGTTYGVAFFSAVLGSAPSHQDGAWVWSLKGAMDPPVPLPASELASCLGSGVDGVHDPQQAVTCVLTASRHDAHAGS